MKRNILISTAENLKPKDFEFESFKSVTKKPFETHRDVLYQNYVKTYNDIMNLIQDTDFAKIKGKVPNSNFAHLKRRVVWAANGAYLHELYFGNISGKNTKPGKCTLQLIKEDFNTLKNFKDHFNSTAFVPPSGWAVWGYSLYSNNTDIVAIENHQNNCPAGFLPILVLDMWEHAYWADHLSDKAKYIEEFWQDIDWDTVEERCQKINKMLDR